MLTIKAYPVAGSAVGQVPPPKAPAKSLDVAKVAQAMPVSQVKQVAQGARAETVNVFGKLLESFFTLSIIFSISLTPFIMIQMLAPQVMTLLISTPVVFIFIPYTIAMVFIGLKISSLFGCSAWRRITGMGIGNGADGNADLGEYAPKPANQPTHKSSGGPAWHL